MNFHKLKKFIKYSANDFTLKKILMMPTHLIKKEWIELMPEAVEIPLKDLKNWLEKETDSIVEPIRAEGMDLLNDTRSKLEELRNSCEKLLEDSEKEMLKSSPKTYRRARTAYKFARDVLEKIDELNIPGSIGYEKLQMLCGDLEKTFATIGRERAGRFRQIAPYFIFDRRRFDGALRKVLDSLKKLRDFSSHGYAKAKAVEDSFVMIDKLLKSLTELDTIDKQKRQVGPRKKVVEEKIDETEQRIELIRSKEEVSELAQTRGEIEELEKTLKRNLRYLEKPFLKFQKLVQGPSYRLPLSETKKLNQYTRHPFEAFATEEKEYPQLRRILQGMDDAMAKGKLKLKRNRLTKAQEKIDDILNKNSLTPLHESCSKALFKRQQLLASEAVTVSKRRQAKLEENLNSLKKRKKLVDSRVAALERRYEVELEDIESQKKELEDAVLEITNKSAKVKL